MTTIDDGVVIQTVIDETREWEVKVAAPPIPLWKIGLVILALIGGGAGAYYAFKRSER